MRVVLIGVVCLLGVSVTVPVLADTDSFFVSQFIGDDTTAPTVPGNFAITPIATTQIDLDWDASSDNVGVSGYQVFRDASQIATTSQTSYADTGLSAATTYAYFVRAFDAAGNISSSTATLSTTTLALPSATSTPVTSGGGAGQSLQQPPLEIVQLAFDPEQTATAVSVETSILSKITIRWGQSNAFSDGYITREAYAHEHRTRITGLSPGTTYQIEVRAEGRYGGEVVTNVYTLTTLSGPDMVSPPNVSALQATRRGETIDLSWQNPTVSDFSHVRVVSNDRYYPQHPADGWLVYEGGNEIAVDDRSLLEGERRFYTVFALDENGNRSSGAIATVYRPVPGAVIDTEPIVFTPEGFSRDSFLLNAVTLLEGNRQIAPQEGVFAVQNVAPLTIRLDYDAFPEHLKTAIVTLTHPERNNETFSFLLKVNADRTAYTASIAPLGDAGRYPLHISVTDFVDQVVYIAEGVLAVQPDAQAAGRQTADDRWVAFTWWRAMVLIGLLLLLLLLWWYTRRGEDRRSSS